MKMKLNNMRIRGFAFVLGALFIGFIWTYVTFLIPVGSVDGDNIYKYEAMQRINLDNAIKGIGKDKAFDTAMKKLGVTVTDAEVESELKNVTDKYGGTDELKSIMIDTESNITLLKNSIRKGMLKQKAIEKFAQEIKTDTVDIKAYYEENTDNYPGEFSANEKQIKTDYAMMKGAQKYDEFLKSYEDSVTIKIY